MSNIWYGDRSDGCRCVHRLVIMGSLRVEPKEAELRLKLERLEKVFRFFRRIAFYMFFLNLSEDSRNLYVAWFFLTITVVLSLPFLVPEIFILMPLRYYRQRLRNRLIRYEVIYEKRT